MSVGKKELLWGPIFLLKFSIKLVIFGTIETPVTDFCPLPP